MKVKNILIAGVVAITSISLPTLANAETSYATPQELLIEALEVAVSGVESTTYDEALDYVESLITVNGSEVSYDGDIIGYWNSTNSDTLFADSAFTDEVLFNGGTNIWEFDPDILSPMLTDFNSKLVETIIPTTEDWSKIIGKYDVTLGDVTIPADQWVEVNPADTLTTANAIDLSNLTGIDATTAGDRYGGNTLYIGSYVVKDGHLYIQPGLIHVWLETASTYWIYNTITTTQASADSRFGGGTAIRDSTCNSIKAGVKLHNNSIALTGVLMSNTLGTTVSNVITFPTGGVGHGVDISNPTTTMTGSAVDGTVGIFYIKGSQLGHTDDATTINTLNNFFTSQSSSKQQIGNTTLKQRLSKFSSLVEGDTIEVTPTAWTIKGLGGEESDFDTYLGSQDVMTPGEETSIPATADIEALAFKVVLPTSLPIYVNELNQVSVATNATIKNESGAAVIVNSVDIEAKPDSGWTLLTSGTPSKARDAKEFTFTTDLVADTVLAVAEERPFRYNAELSPSTEGVEQLDLASVLVTIDWAPNP